MSQFFNQKDITSRIMLHSNDSNTALQMDLGNYDELSSLAEFLSCIQPRSPSLLDYVEKSLAKATNNNESVVFGFDEIYTKLSKETATFHFMMDPLEGTECTIQTDVFERLLDFWVAETAKFQKLKEQGRPQDYVWDPSVLKKFGLA